MIDHNTLETAAAIAGIATLGGIVIFSMRGPKPEEEFSDADREAIKWTPHPVSATVSPDPYTGAVYRDAPVVSMPRYFVDDFAEVDGFHVEDRNTGLTIPQPYKTRSTALRAARRLNAKAEIEAAK